MPLRLCQDCPAIHTGPGTRCPGCQQAHDARRPSTTSRGYGPAHQAERTRRLAVWQRGDRCPICHQPAYDRNRLDLAHNQDRTGYLPGLAHDTCNRRTNT